MNDYIERQTAIKSLYNEIIKRRILGDVDDGMLDEFDIESILQKLPSADVLQWIPCNSDNMPDTNDEVLTTYIVNGDDKKRYVEAATWWKDDSDEGGYWTSLSDEYRKIGTRVERLAWRPMPAPWRSN